MTADDTRPDEGPDLLARVRADEARAAAIDGRLIDLVRDRWRDSGLMWDRSAAVDAIEAVLGALALLPAPPAPAVPVTAPDDTLRALSDAATPGEWCVVTSGLCGIARKAWSVTLADTRNPDDAAFIAAAANYVRAALAADRTPPAGDEASPDDTSLLRIEGRQQP